MSKATMSDSRFKTILRQLDTMSDEQRQSLYNTLCNGKSDTTTIPQSYVEALINDVVRYRMAAEDQAKALEFAFHMNEPLSEFRAVLRTISMIGQMEHILKEETTIALLRNLLTQVMTSGMVVKAVFQDYGNHEKQLRINETQMLVSGIQDAVDNYITSYSSNELANLDITEAESAIKVFLQSLPPAYRQADEYTIWMVKKAHELKELGYQWKQLGVEMVAQLKAMDNRNISLEYLYSDLSARNLKSRTSHIRKTYNKPKYDYLKVTPMQE